MSVRAHVTKGGGRGSDCVSALQGNGQLWRDDRESRCLLAGTLRIEHENIGSLLGSYHFALGIMKGVSSVSPRTAAIVGLPWITMKVERSHCRRSVFRDQSARIKEECALNKPPPCKSATPFSSMPHSRGWATEIEAGAACCSQNSPMRLSIA
jgi:hypothetical protein